MAKKKKKDHTVKRGNENGHYMTSNMGINKEKRGK